ncbi:MAG: helix-hairpin-helix domain-containing protein [Chloroflexi bacterium]|nr:helix-hairpin-helix domain-containing protein [Chloroflexota bacterium]
MTQKQAQWWLPIALFLALAAAAGGFLLASNLRDGRQVEIVLPTATPSPDRQIYIDGAVNSPGSYTARDADSLEDLLNAAGGASADANLDQLKLTVPRTGRTSSPQTVNINTADPWLLEALPGIGERLAKAIVGYRKENGPFRSTRDLTRVPGITPKVYERIEKLIAVGE